MTLTSGSGLLLTSHRTKARVVAMSGQSSGCGFLMSVVVHGDSALNEQEKELNQRLRRLYPAVNENETPLPRSWSPKDKFSYIGLSQNNLRVHYKGMTQRRTKV